MKTLPFVLRIYIVVIYNDELALPPKNNAMSSFYAIVGS